MSLLHSAVSVAVLALISNVSAGVALAWDQQQPSVVSSLPSSPSSLLAQAAPTPFCRRSNRRLDVYSQSSVASESISEATIESDTNVFLVEQAPGEGFEVENGFVEVIVPSANNVLGYVIARHLKGCPGQPPEPQAQCARVAVPLLTVRSDASILSSTIGQVRSGQTVRILSDRNGAVQNQRIWVNIPFDGTTGWVAETGQFGQGRNLSQRFPCPR